MVGLVIATHGHLADELLVTARQIVGELPRVATCSIEPGTGPEEIKKAIEGAVHSVDDGEGVIVFADLVGGTPCNQSLTLCQNALLEVITGVNLPMLLKAVALRRDPPMRLADLAHQLAQYGQRNITCATDALRSRSTAA